MISLICKNKHRFSITDDTFNEFVSDMDTIIRCPRCGSTDVNSNITGRR